jgi:hypothetical protein
LFDSLGGELPCKIGLRMVFGLGVSEKVENHKIGG